MTSLATIPRPVPRNAPRSLTRLVVSVYDSKYNLLSDARVELAENSQAKYTTANGVVEFRGLLPGTYNLNIEYSGKTYTKTVYIKNGEVLQKTIVVMPNVMPAKTGWILPASLLTALVLISLAVNWIFIIIEKRRIHHLLKYHY